MGRSNELDERKSLSHHQAVDVELGQDAETTSLVSNRSFRVPKKTTLFSALIVLVGLIASSAFIAVGLTAANREQNEQFDRRSYEIVNGIESSFQSYEVGGLHIHESCREGCTRKKFRAAFEILVSTGLVFQVTSYNPNTTHAERDALEAESRAFVDEFYPHISYRGILGLEPNPDGSLSVQNRSEAPFYFPVHFLEPVETNENALDFDLYSSGSRRRTIHLALSTWKPALTPRLRLVQETEENAYSVILMHPGVSLSTEPDLRPRDFSSMVVRIPDLIRHATRSQVESSKVFIYDSTDMSKPPEFLGGSTVIVKGPEADQFRELSFEDELPLENLLRQSSSTKVRETEIQVASNRWTIVVIALEGTYQPAIVQIILGGIAILGGCFCLAVWLFTNMRRQTRISRMEAEAEAEKAAIILQNARKAARAQRELNDFIAHEVRNPLAAAMSACSFVSTELQDVVKPLNRSDVLEDVGIIQSSLNFINDLLRNMLDMQRASSNQLEIEMAPTDIKKDVLLPVDAMLYSRGSPFEVQVSCPDNLFVMTDRLRLKQIVINLARNSTKFVSKGFIRLRTEVERGSVSLFVEDSGPGIPDAKRKQLFAKFQQSLDSLHQGTGIGLSLCKNLSELMGASIEFDETFASGIPGCRGTRFIIRLNKPPIGLSELDLSVSDGGESTPETEESSISSTLATPVIADTSAVLNQDGQHQTAKEQTSALPENLSVLFVDDDMVLRKLFVRAVRKVAPAWKVKDASNGETCLRYTEDEDFDVIFIDQYMTSVEKQLLGTETTRLLRAKGVKSTICGLSANDTEQLFLEAGANAFMMKPFPCEKGALNRELERVLLSNTRMKQETANANSP